MRLYSDTCSEFAYDVSKEVIADKLADAYFRETGRHPGKAEYRSWKNSLPSMHFACAEAGLSNQGIVIEYQLPATSKRLDVLLCGKGANGKDSALIVELKQWEECEPGDGEHVITWTGGGLRDVLHPSVQVSQYRTFLADGNTAFHEEGRSPIALSACAWLHNYDFLPDDPLLEAKFDGIREVAPVFTKPQRDALVEHISQSVGNGSGEDVLERALAGEERPSKKLLEHVGGLLDGSSEYVLLDEQLIAFDRVIAETEAALAGEEGGVVLIKGGPGTGKSVIALNLLTELSKRGANAHYATGSKSFRNSLHKIVGRRASQVFTYFSHYYDKETDFLDVVICDEAHRIREATDGRWIKKEKRSGKPQIAEILDAAKVSVFFIDDLQVVRPGEVGSVDLVKEFASDRDTQLFEYELEAQFRCAGSDGFINWVTDALGIKDTANPIWHEDEDFLFEIVESPEELMSRIEEKADEGHSARVMAGYSWPWSDPKSDGTLEDDVVIGEFARPWNARSGKTRLAEGIPREDYWATDPNGINQIGCVYTAQGFEFDFAGVIFGPDLVYREGKGWMGRKEFSEDRMVKRGVEDITAFIQNTYRVLLTRGMKGCFIYFMDQETREHFAGLMRPSLPGG